MANAHATDFFEEGTVWEVGYDSQTTHTVNEILYKYYLEGDTVIGGLPCLKMWGQNISANTGRELVTCIYKEGEKIYFFPHKNSEEKALLYDFSLQPNQSTTVVLPSEKWENKDSQLQFEMKCNSLSSVSLGTQAYEVIEITEITESPEWDGYKSSGQTRWIKGIGSVFGVLENAGVTLDGGSSQLKRVTHKGLTVIEYGVISGIQGVKASGKEARKYRLDGILLPGSAKGICISGGKKVLR